MFKFETPVVRTVIMEASVFESGCLETPGLRETLIKAWAFSML
jgi:hypothetical protein